MVYILSRYIEIFDSADSLASSAELKWCLHVIQNDFLQISNSLLTTPRASGKNRRFSKTQRILSFDSKVEIGVLNALVG